jgi:hypothetical protein
MQMPPALLALSTTAAVFYAAALWSLLVVPGAITVLKRQWGLFLLGFIFTSVVWIIASFRLARPDSPWSRRFYNDAKRERARARYS